MLDEGNVRGLQQRAVGGGRIYRRKTKSAAECADASRPGDLQVPLVGRPVEHRHKQLASTRKAKPFSSAEGSMISRMHAFGRTPHPLGHDTANDDAAMSAGDDSAGDGSADDGSADSGDEEREDNVFQKQ